MEKDNPQTLTRLQAKRRITQLLVEEKLITHSQLDQIVDNQTEQGDATLEKLFSLGYLTPNDFLDFLLAHPGLNEEDLAHFEINQQLIAMLPPDLAHKHQIVPIDHASDTLTVAATTPLDDATRDALCEATQCAVHAIWCQTEDVVAAINRYYPKKSEDTPPAQPKAAEASHPNNAGLANPIRLNHTAHLIRQIKTLPALPETVTQVKEATQRPDCSIEEIVHIITLDPPIAAKVLGVANSPAYGFKHQVHDVKLAISLMGLKETYAIVLSAAVVDMVSKLKQFDYRTFFLEAVCCATAARIVAKTAGKQDLPGIFSAGLLHDIGKAALWEAAPELCAKIDKNLQGKESIQAEERDIGLSHAEAGYELANYWQLPPEIAQPIRLHHDFHRATDLKENVAAVAIANEMVAISGATIQEHPEFYPNNEAALKTLNIDEELAEAMLEKYLDRHQNAVREAFG
jgi:putative nucleotidyltransferase with HDIG domain